MDPTILSAWPHAEGMVRLSYSPSGQYLYTGGSESYIRVFETDANNDDGEAGNNPKLIEFHTEGINCLDSSSDYMCSAEDDGTVAIHAHKTNALVGIITRSSLPARSARFDSKGKRLAITSDELTVKIVDVNDTIKIQVLAGHTKSVRHASWSPNGNYLATSSCDGTMRIWNFSSGEPSCVKVIDGLICIDHSESYFSAEAVWHPSGTYFVVPSRTQEIVVVSQESGWSRDGTFSEDRDGHTSEISALAFSSNGLYLASCGKEGLILVWNSTTRSVITRSTQTNGIISDIAFRPAPSKANELAYVDVTGQMTRWLSVIPSNLTGPSTPNSNSAKSLLTNGNGKSNGIDDEAGEGSEDDLMGDERRSEEREDEGPNDWIDDDLGLDDGGKRNGYKDLREKPKAWEMTRGDYSAKRVGQNRIQPGSTSFRESRKYLAFNMIGFIHVLERDDRNIVTIEFHDRASRTGTHFDDVDKCTLGALGDFGSIFSAPPTSTAPSLIFYKPYISWTTPHAWVYELPAGESSIALAISAPPSTAQLSHSFTDDQDASGTVIVATSKGYLRFLTGSGVQKYLWQIGGEILGMASGRETLIVLHREFGEGAVGEFTLLDLESFEVLQVGKIPVTSEGTVVTWVGFTEDDIPAIYNSEGILSILDRSRRPRQARWVPALETNNLDRKARNTQESYWPIGVSAENVHVIILKGSETQPHFPTPLFQELQLQFPLLRLDVPQGQLEEQYLRETLFVSHRRDGCPSTDYSLLATLSKDELTTDKHLLKLIQLLCKAEHLSSALDAVQLLTQPASLEAAGKIAHFFRLPGLEDRIERVREEKSNAGRREAEEGGKRDGKWNHLVDLRTIVASSTASSSALPPSSFMTSAVLGRKRLNALDSTALTNGGSSAGGPSTKSRKRTLVTNVEESTKYGSYEDDDEENGESREAMEGDSMIIDDEEGNGERNGSKGMSDDEERSSKRMRSEEVVDEEGEVGEVTGEDYGHYGQPEEEEELEYADEEEEMPPPPAKKPHNPFAKKAQPIKEKAVSSPANPFAAKKSKGDSATTKDLKRTTSFFNRVEGKETSKTRSTPTASKKDDTKSKAKAKAKATPASTSTVSGGRQTTLFGMAPGEVKPKEKKKRANAEVDGEVEDEGSKKQSSLKAGMAKMSKKDKELKELPREGEEFEDSQVDDPETQEETQITKRGREQEEADNAGEVEEEEELEDTQVDDEELTGEDVEAVVEAPTASKLDRFKLME